MIGKKAGKLRPAQSRATYPTLKAVFADGRSLFTNLGAAVLATGIGACSSGGLHPQGKADAGSPDQVSVGQPDAILDDASGDDVLPPDTRSFADVYPDVAPETGREAGRDGPIELGQPDRLNYPDGVPAVYGRDAGPEATMEAGPDRFEVRIVDGGPAMIDWGSPRDLADAAADRPDSAGAVDVDQTAVDTGSESGAK